MFFFINFFLEYGTSEVGSTYPSNNEIIPLYTSTINIKYNSQVEKSINNILIYQNFTSKPPYLRQIIPGDSEYITYSKDYKSLYINILNTTFNQQDSEYL